MNSTYDRSVPGFLLTSRTQTHTNTQRTNGSFELYIGKKKKKGLHRQLEVRRQRGQGRTNQQGKVLKPIETHTTGDKSRVQVLNNSTPCTLHRTRQKCRNRLYHQMHLPNTGGTKKYNQHASYNFSAVPKLKWPTNPSLPAVNTHSCAKPSAQSPDAGSHKNGGRCPTHQTALPSRKGSTTSANKASKLQKHAI